MVAFLFQRVTQTPHVDPSQLVHRPVRDDESEDRFAAHLRDEPTAVREAEPPPDPPVESYEDRRRGADEQDQASGSETPDGTADKNPEREPARAETTGDTAETDESAQDEGERQEAGEPVVVAELLVKELPEAELSEPEVETAEPEPDQEVADTGRESRGESQREGQRDVRLDPALETTAKADVPAEGAEAEGHEGDDRAPRVTADQAENAPREAVPETAPVPQPPEDKLDPTGRPHAEPAATDRPERSRRARTGSSSASDALEPRQAPAVRPATVQRAVEPSRVDEVALPGGDGGDERSDRERPSPEPSPVPAAGRAGASAESNEPPLANRFSQHLMLQASQRAARDTRLNPAQQARFVDRVARALQSATARGGTLRVRLHPPELGALRLEVRVESNVMTARLEAETPVARSLLLDHLPVLRDRLADQGVRVESFDVDLMDRQAGDTSDQLDQQESDDASSGPRHGESEELEPESGTKHRPGSGDEQLDVVA